jgi:glycosyltransferase involved in cell wall biosynthesis
VKSILIVGPKKSQHIQRWFKGWDSKSISCYLFTLHNSGREFNFPVTEINFNLTGKKLDFLLSIPMFVITWWKIRPQVTNFHYLTSYALLSLFIPKKNLVLNVWGTDVNRPFNNQSSWLSKWLIKKALRRFSWINAPAEHMKIKLIDLGAKPETIDVFQYGIEVSVCPIRPLITNSDKIIFVSNRNWQSIYRIEQVLLGFKKFILDNPQCNAQLWLYGSGEPGASFLEEFMKIAPKSVHDRITVKGYKEHSEMLSQMKTAHVFLSIPITDGTPLSLLEAMDLGLYPILSDIDANREWVRNDFAEFVSDVNSTNVASAFLNSYLKLRRNDFSFVNQNWLIVKKNADANANIKKFQSVLSKFFIR